MNIHDRNQPRIVYTDSSDSILKDATFPFLIGQRRIRQDGKEALDLVDDADAERDYEAAFDELVGCYKGAFSPELLKAVREEE